MSASATDFDPNCWGNKKRLRPLPLHKLHLGTEKVPVEAPTGPLMLPLLRAGFLDPTKWHPKYIRGLKPDTRKLPHALAWGA